MIKPNNKIIMIISVIFFLTATLSFAVSTDVNLPEGFDQDSTVSGWFSEDVQVNYFLLSVSGDGQVVISTTANTGSVFFRVYAANPEENGGENIISYDYDDNSNYYALKAGQYKISVIPQYEATSYTMTNAYAPPTFAADPDNNDTILQSSTLLQKGEEFAEVYGHHGYAYDAYGGMPVYNRSDTIDVWKIETEEDGYLVVDSAIAEELKFNLYLYDETDQLMVAYSESDSLTTVEHQLAAGTYYIKTDYDYNSVPNFGSYKLTASLDPMFIQNDPEPNDETLTATVLPVNGEDTGHIGFSDHAHDSVNGYYKIYDTDDYWKITTTEDGILSVATTANEDYDEGPYVHLYVYSDDGKLMQSNYNFDEKLVNTASLNVSAGTYYIDVKHEEGYGSYLIACELDTTALATDTEPNDTKEDAVEVTLEEPVTGHLGFITDTSSALSNVHDTRDIWKVSYDEDTVLELTLTVEADFEDTLSTYLYVYDEEYNTILHSDYNSKQLVKNSIPLARESGFVYVRVDHVDGYGSYTLSSTLTPAALAGDANPDNPNDAIADATQLPIDNVATGHLGFEKKNKDYNDYWTFYADKEDTLYVTAVSQDEFGEGPAMYLQLSKDGTTLISDMNDDKGDTTQVAYYVTPGTYVAGVRLKSDGGYGSYTLSVSYLSDVSILTTTLDNATTGEQYSMPIDVRYGGEETVMYELLDSPEWLTISEAGVLSGTPTSESEIQITLRAYISASDDTLSTSLIVNNTTNVTVDNHPSAFSVSSPFPNPFNPSTTIRYSVPVESEVRLEIFDIFGRKVAVLADGRMSPGVYDAVWDSRINAGGSALGSGVYIYRFSSQGYSHTGKVMLLQ
ncbi:T9SS type A sorting domain-containing protein [Candidatus Latescibacterota bacterium]